MAILGVQNNGAGFSRTYNFSTDQRLVYDADFDLVYVAGHVVTEVGFWLRVAPATSSTVQVGIYDISSGRAGAPLIYTKDITANSGSTAESYITVTGLSDALSGLSGGETLAFAVTLNAGDAWEGRRANENTSIGTTALTLNDPWSESSTNTQEAPDGYIVIEAGGTTPTVNADASTSPGDTINHTVADFGGTINSATLDDGTSTLTLTSPGDTSAVVPALGNDIQYTTLGAARTYTVGDGTDTATDTVDLDPPAGYTLVTLGASPATGATSWLYNYGNPAAEGDQGVYDPIASDTGATLTLNDDGTWSSTASGTWTDIFVIDATDGWMDQITFTAVGIIESPTEVYDGQTFSITLDLEKTITSVTIDGVAQTIDSQTAAAGETVVNLTAVQGVTPVGTAYSLVANLSDGGLADADIDIVEAPGAGGIIGLKIADRVRSVTGKSLTGKQL